MIDHRLITYVTIVRLGSFTKASEVLHLTQPAISKQMKSLQEEQGMLFVHLHHNSFSLTSFGKRFYEIGSRLLLLEENAKKELESLKKGIQIIRIGYESKFKYSKILKNLSKLTLNHPNIQLKLMEVQEEDIAKSLEDLSFHYVISSNGSLDKGIKDRLLYIDPYMGYSSFDSHGFTLNEVKKLPLLTLDGYKRHRGLHYQMILDDLSLLEKVIREGYVAILPRNIWIDHEDIYRHEIKGMNLKEEAHLLCLNEFDPPYEEEIVSLSLLNASNF